MMAKPEIIRCAPPGMIRVVICDGSGEDDIREDYILGDYDPSVARKMAFEQVRNTTEYAFLYNDKGDRCGYISNDKPS